MHTANNCRSTYVCKICLKQHHTLLHYNNFQIKKSYISQGVTMTSILSDSRHLPQTSIIPAESHHTKDVTTSQVALGASSKIINNVYDNQNNYGTILLSTAQFYDTKKYNKFISDRCVLDNVSQNNIITSAC